MQSRKRVGLYSAGLGVLAIFSMLFSANQSVEARPNYLATFKAKYGEKYNGQQLKCNVCHLGDKPGKNRNDFGQALAKELGAPSVTDADKIKEAFDKLEKMDSKTKDKTYGDLINDGKMPGKAGSGSEKGDKTEKSSGSKKSGGSKRKRGG